MNSTHGITGDEVKHLHHLHDPETSATAAASVNRDEASVVQQAILELLAEKPRADFELIPAYAAIRESRGWPIVQLHSIARRRSELYTQGKVRATPERRQTEYGRPATVWAVKEATR